MTYLVLTGSPDAPTRAQWDDFALNSAQTTHYVTPSYFVDPYVSGDRFAILAIGDDGKVNAVLTGVADRGRVIAGMFSRPQVAFRDGADRAEAVDNLVEGLGTVARASRSLIEVYSWERCVQFPLRGMRESLSNDTNSVVMLDLASGADAVFAKFSQTRRNEIRKAIKQAAVEVAPLKSDEELVELYEIYCEWNRRKGHAPGPLEQMRAGVAQRENRLVLVAKVAGRVVAGSFYRFGPQGIIEYSANVSMLEHQKLRPNDLIGWRAVQWACERGFRQFSMGGSHLFLRRFGGDILPTFRYRVDQTLLKRYDLAERAVKLRVQTLRSLPEPVRDRVRKLFGR